MKFRKDELERRQVTTALVLSGGGAKGAYQVGVIKELLKRGVQFDLVIGSSIGAFNGALLSEFIQRGFSAEQIAQNLVQIWMGLSKFITFNWWGFLKNIFSPTQIPSIYSNRGMKKVINHYLPAHRCFNHYKNCQLSVTATNLSRKTLQIFDYNSDVSVRKAVLASMAYPVALPSVKIAGEYFVDGGALNNAPLKEAILWGARKIYLVFLTPLAMIEGEKKLPVEEEEEDYPALKTAGDFIDLVTNKLMYGDLGKAERINQLIQLLNRYENSLPKGFLQEIRQLYKLKFGEGKRIIEITKIAPQQVLNPPGVKGFDQQAALKNLIRMGARDVEKGVQEEILP